MFRYALALAAVICAAPVFGQELDPNNRDGDHGGFTLTPELDLNGTFGAIEEVEREQVAVTDSAVLRALDRVAGTVTDLTLTAGQIVTYGRLTVVLSECRYPKDNPSGDAFSYMTIRPIGETQPVFEGWMVASSPALNAMDHPRYDVWLLRCNTS